MQSLPVDLLVEVLLGLYLGLLTGIVPAFVAGALGFLVRYFTGVTLPGFGVVVLALSIASVQGGLLGLVEPTIAQSPRLLIAVLVVLMLALYAHNQGDKLGAELPRRLSLTSLRQRTLSAEVVELVGSVGQVTVRPTGEIHDMEGYPPLSPDLRRDLKAGSWRLPADLPLSELESRLEERLRTDHDLVDVDVAIDQRARATIVAAPPSGTLSKRVPAGQRAVSIATLVPTGLARGDEVTVLADDRSISGTVLSARTEIDDERAASDAPDEPIDEVATDGGEDEAVAIVDTKPNAATAGGPGRVTVAVARRDVKPVLEAESPRLVVRSRGTSREFEAFALVKREGYAVRRFTVGATGADDETIGFGDHASAADLTILAVRRQGSETGSRRHGWVFGPGIERRLEAGDEAFVAGPEDAIEAFAEAIAR